MKFTALAAGSLALAVGAFAAAAPASAQTYRQGYMAPQSQQMVVPPAAQMPDRYGAVVVPGYGDEPVRVSPSTMRTNAMGQPCRTVEKKDQKGLYRSYTYCN